jgi:hypothetical protein
MTTLAISSDIPAPKARTPKRYARRRIIPTYHPPIPLESLLPGQSLFVSVITPCDRHGLHTSWLRQRIKKFRTLNPTITLRVDVATENRIKGRRILRIS